MQVLFSLKLFFLTAKMNSWDKPKTFVSQVIFSEAFNDSLDGQEISTAWVKAFT